MALYLHCVICSRKQANGLLSGAAWGRIERPPPAPTIRVCPTCMSTNPDWQSRALGGVADDDGGVTAATA